MLFFVIILLKQRFHHEITLILFATEQHGHLHSLSFSADGQQFVSACDGQYKVRIWSEEGNLLQSLKGESRVP